MKVVIIATCLLALATPAAGQSEIPDTPPAAYRFALFPAAAGPVVPPVWETTFPFALATCGQPKPPDGAGQGPLVVDPEGLVAAWDDTFQQVGAVAECYSPVLKPPLACAADCPVYQGYLQAIHYAADGTPEASPWEPGTPPLTMGPRDTACDAPLGTEAAAVFVTRPGLARPRAWVNFFLASKSPITDIVAKIDGVEVGRIPTAPDLTTVGAIWFTMPAPGSYKLTVWVRNAHGCTRETFSPIDLVVPVPK